LGVAGWAAVSDALERVTGLTSLNGCGDYAAICAGGLKELTLNKEWELGVWAARFLKRSARTLTKLDVRYRYHTIILVLIVITSAYRFSPLPPLGPSTACRDSDSARLAAGPATPATHAPLEASTVSVEARGLPRKPA
jgi:hypothetical protein